MTKMAELVGASRQSRANARTLLDAALKASKDVVAFAGDLFAIVEVLDSSAALRRALTDPSRTSGDKSAFVRGLLGSKFSSASADLVAQLAEMRWSGPSDLADVLEQLAIEAEASAANVAGELDRLEDELFSFSRIVASNGDLRQNLSSQTFPMSARQELVASLAKGKVSAATSRMLAHIVAGLRGRNIESTMSYYQGAIAARRERVIAHVRTAVSISDSQRQKIAEVLATKIGQPVRVNLEIDPSVMGGVSIRFADELIDATIVSRLADAGRALAG
ncbi:MAG: F0F1 ATP synthase subunit delta [Actinomycetota bacterium]